MDERARLIVYLGLPASGKSTDAKRRVAQSPETRHRINRDDARRMLHGGYRNRATERKVTLATHATMRALLTAGDWVYCDDTNLNPAHRTPLRVLAESCGADFELIDMRDVPLQVCRDRNAQRTGDEHVPDQAIVDMYHKWIAPGGNAEHNPQQARAS